MDQAQRLRLKIFARAEATPLDEDLNARLIDSGYDAVVERAYLFHVEAFDWNCPQHITPRFSIEELCEMGDDALQAMLADAPALSHESCAGAEPFKPFA